MQAMPCSLCRADLDGPTSVQNSVLAAWGHAAYNRTITDGDWLPGYEANAKDHARC
jgi:hypothetical protein